MERSDADERAVPFRWKSVVGCKFDVHFRFAVLRPISSSNILSNNSSEKNSFVLILRVFLFLLQNRGETERQLTKPRGQSWTMLIDRFLLVEGVRHAFFVFGQFIERHSAAPQIRIFERFVLLFERKRIDPRERRMRRKFTRNT